MTMARYVSLERLPRADRGCRLLRGDAEFAFGSRHSDAPESEGSPLSLDLRLFLSLFFSLPFVLSCLLLVLVFSLGLLFRIV